MTKDEFYPMSQESLLDPGIRDILASEFATFPAVGPLEDLVRQEAAVECDVNVILGRFGVGALTGPKGVANVEVDYSADLASLYESARELAGSWSGMSPELRELYPTPAAFLAAVASGRVYVPNDKVAPPSEAPLPQEAGPGKASGIP